jgi:transcription initiation factor TFIIIB Brf1 subunit/transcription initiation factor TFIIB
MTWPIYCPGCRSEIVYEGEWNCETGCGDAYLVIEHQAFDSMAEAALEREETRRYVRSLFDRLPSVRNLEGTK